MQDTISRQAAIDYFVINVGFHDEDGYPIEDTDELRKIWTEYFDGIPSAESEIIRCKDCKWWSDKRMTVGRLCTVTERYTDAEFFCKAGRSKDE